LPAAPERANWCSSLQPASSKNQGVPAPPTIR
jgi:hypothetical protein